MLMAVQVYHAAIILDAGGLLANISGYWILRPITAGAAVQLELVDKAGLACGSETLTKLLLERIEDYANIHPREYLGGFEGMLESLYMTRLQAESYLSAELNSRKVSRIVPLQLSFTLMGRNQATGQDVEKRFRSSRSAPCSLNSTTYIANIV